MYHLQVTIQGLKKLLMVWLEGLRSGLQAHLMHDLEPKGLELRAGASA